VRSRPAAKASAAETVTGANRFRRWRAGRRRARRSRRNPRRLFFFMRGWGSDHGPPSSQPGQLVAPPLDGHAVSLGAVDLVSSAQRMRWGAPARVRAYCRAARPARKESSTTSIDPVRFLRSLQRWRGPAERSYRRGDGRRRARAALGGPPSTRGWASPQPPVRARGPAACPPHRAAHSPAFRFGVVPRSGQPLGFTHLSQLPSQSPISPRTLHLPLKTNKHTT